ncbi:MAG: hypothetical protein WA839_14515 [Flavobacteriaceae bacterium]|tara:strand:+ start:938 stop:1267 length:330 start_codon:yes stop_codon:yes gene_type:complete
MKYSVLSNKELNIQNSDGIQVSGYSDAWIKSQRKAVKEATDNALKEAGTEYDILINGTIEMEYKVLFIRYRVNGTAYKSVDLLNKFGKVGFKEWKKGKSIFDRNEIASE